MTPPPPPVLRAYLKDIQPETDLPRSLTDTLVLRSRSDAGLVPADGDPNLRDIAYVLDVYNTEDRLAIVHAVNAISAVRIASECSVVVVGYWSDVGFIDSAEGETIVWGHYTQELSEDAMVFTNKYFDVLMCYLVPDSYSRLANALRLYGEALHVRNADLALLGFVGAIESLFSIAPQELSFRLSLLLAKFLGDDASQQREYFDRARELYKIRSKIAHGDKIDKDEEAAAIQIVETWVPEAEQLARGSLKRLFEKGVTDIFDAKKKHDRLLTELLFEVNLDAVLGNRT